jgi:hypothetical protein
MIVAPVITTGLNAIVLALTPAERWEAMGRFNSNFMTESWFLITSILAIIILTISFFVVSYIRGVRERKASGQLFARYAERGGLSGRERQILSDVASKAGLGRNESIFTMGNAFNHGAAKMIKERLAEHGAEDSRRLSSGLSFLREKLGFQKQYFPSAGSLAKSNKLSSRQIPIGKKLFITRLNTRDLGEIESTVIENDDMELTVKLARPAESAAGEFWRAHYYFGASVWEFDTSVVSRHGSILVLNHSDNVRFINRRRFLRVSIKRPAFIAHFPFSKTLSPKKESSESEQGSSSDPGCVLEPPEFAQAVVTELAGPGLRMETSLEVKVGERVLVVFRLDEENDVDLSEEREDDKTTAPRIIEDIGEVRNIETIKNGFSISVELTGLSDSNIDELICATNAISMKAAAESEDVPGSVNAEGAVSEPAAV